MQAQVIRWLRDALVMPAILCVVFAAGMAGAAPYASMVMDARNGEVIFARNHDTRLHPASLTKLMTIYVAFEAIKHGEVTLETKFTTSKRATQQTCVCLGLRQGQKLSLRYLIRAAALRSANDAAVVIAEGISGSVEAFAERMTRTARAMGMNNTTFRNPHGLTQSGHVSTARDMTILGRQLYFDYPQYFNLFSRRSEDAGVTRVANTNRRFLDSYTGADGIKTGYTRAAGFNLTASARRGERHIIATMFGGTSAAARNAHVAELLDIGFRRANARVATRAPRTPDYQGRRGAPAAVAQAPATPARNGDDDPTAAAKTIRLQLAVRKSPRPQPRPLPAPDDELLLAVRESVETAVAAAASEPSPDPEPEDLSPVVAALAPEALAVTPRPRPDDLATELAISAGEEDVDLAAAVEAGFSVAEPADLAALDDEAEADLSEDLADGARASATDPAEIEAEAGQDMARADAVEDGAEAPVEAETIALSEDPRTEESEAFAASAHAQAEPILGEDTVWIGGETAFLPDPAAANPPASPAMAAESQEVLSADLDLTPERRMPAANPDIILTSTPSVGRAEPDAHSITTATEAQAAQWGETVRLSTSDTGRLWGVSLGEFHSRAAAERSLITVKMAEAAALGNGVSRIRQVSGRFEASVAGLTQTEAERACLRLVARSMDCDIARP
ncbi:MAG: D-alanyl-D-alanine carboxypeptidase [Rhodobacteraceae bacterium]|nr:MAG: D-alanyl-D-alanine carboxypeptidase [Paracoccaceae bacterium]